MKAWQIDLDAQDRKFQNQGNQRTQVWVALFVSEMTKKSKQSDALTFNKLHMDEITLFAWLHVLAFFVLAIYLSTQKHVPRGFLLQKKPGNIFLVAKIFVS